MKLSVILKIENIYDSNKQQSEVKAMKTRLRELRARDSLNQTQLAKLAKVSRQTISLIEREEYIPSLLIAKRMANIFNEPIEKIFIFNEEEL